MRVRRRDSLVCNAASRLTQELDLELERYHDEKAQAHGERERNQDLSGIQQSLPWSARRCIRVHTRRCIRVHRTHMRGLIGSSSYQKRELYPTRRTCTRMARAEVKGHGGMTRRKTEETSVGYLIASVQMPHWQQGPH